MKLSALPSLLRVHNALFGALSVITSILLFEPSNFVKVLTLGVIAYVSLSAAGNVINDIYDIEIDKVNRPGRPIPSGNITKREAKGIYVVLLFLGLSASVYSSFLIKSPIPFIVATIFAGIGVLYSAKLKVMGFIGNVCVGISFSIGYIYGLIISTLEPSRPKLVSVLLFFMTAVSLLISREIIKGIEDMEGDKKRGVKTLARTIGVRNSAVISSIFGIAAIFSYTALLFIPFIGELLFFLPFVVTGDIAVTISIILITFGRKWARKSSLFSKIGMFIGLLGFFFVSLFQGGIVFT